MSAETLRRAAVAIRRDWPAGLSTEDADFYRAVADWLVAEAEAHIHSAGYDRAIYDMPGMDNAPAVVVARAYLGEQP